ncbi:MAG: hypothetical protein P9M03_09135 [Candidatus Theseobacter exili]|nr:hypothetical protein [Candidatus Theseobacter exili]
MPAYQQGKLRSEGWSISTGAGWSICSGASRPKSPAKGGQFTPAETGYLERFFHE